MAGLPIQVHFLYFSVVLLSEVALFKTREPCFIADSRPYHNKLIIFMLMRNCLYYLLVIRALRAMAHACCHLLWINEADVLSFQGKNLKGEKVEVWFCQCNQEAAMETREISIMQSKLVTIYAALLNETLQIAEISGIRWTATPLNTSKSKVPAAYADRKWFRNPQKISESK